MFYPTYFKRYNKNKEFLNKEAINLPFKPCIGDVISITGCIFRIITPIFDTKERNFLCYVRPLEEESPDTDDGPKRAVA